MSLSEPSIVYHHLDRITSKRKLEDYISLEEDFPVRTKREAADSSDAVTSYAQEEDDQKSSRVLEFDDDERNQSDQFYSSNTGECSQEIEMVKKSLHFFVRMMIGGKTIVIHANLDDTVESVHEQIRGMTGIPIFEQRLIYRGKQLELVQTLEECGIQNDAGLQLVGRMRSTEFPTSWRCVNDLVSAVSCLRKVESVLRWDTVNHWDVVSYSVKEFLRMTPKDNPDRASGHIDVFKSAGAITALVMLFLSPIGSNKECAEEAIRYFLLPNVESLPKSTQLHCAPIVFEFCKMLYGVSSHEPLYDSCRMTLGFCLQTIGCAHGSRYFDYAKPSVVIKEFYPFVYQLAMKLSMSFEVQIPHRQKKELSDTDVFTALVRHVCRAIEAHLGSEAGHPIHLHSRHSLFMVEIKHLNSLFELLLEKIKECLEKVEGILLLKGALEQSESLWCGWFQCIPVLKELSRMSKFFHGAKDKLVSVMRSRRVPLNALIMCLKRSDDNYWLFEYKDVMDFESRRHLVMMMFPDVNEDYEVMHEMLIDRSQLLEESFEYIAHTEPQSLRGGLFMEFKNEEATGPGVLREWFYMVCKAIFNPQNPLFLACPNDHRRFLPNPASKVDSLHLDYFCFCGRMLALALMHKMQVGIVLDRVFFLQLANKFVSLEDVRDADPCFYMSCKRILEMDAEFLDSDALGLTFVQEIEELGSRKTVELCPGGKDIIVNSNNREQYINLLIQHRFVTSTRIQVARFAQGFADILCHSRLRETFFQGLELDDLDRMLYGSDKPLCVKDWKAHTEYSGYKDIDRQIHWFWKVVDCMPKEQQRGLLFFWTSLRYLPLDGFRGLKSRLHIYKAAEPVNRLPTSHTCFYRLCLPPYPSLKVMRERLNLVTQEHVSCSFGNF